jgi:type II secretory pathway predicted ATPase ExeA
MGKTTILLQLVNQLKKTARTSYLYQTLCRPDDLLRALLLDLGVTEHSGNMVGLQEQLNRVLWDEARQGRTVVVVIDEAQNLDDSTLELVRVISNFETMSVKLIQIVLAGQLQLRDKLASPGLVQLRQRVSVRARLSPFNAADTHAYIEHRLRVAGYNFQKPLFTAEAEALIATHSEGIPRNINNICFNALSLGWVLKQRTIEKRVIREVLNDLDIEAEGNEVSGPGWIGWKAIKPKTVLHSLTCRSGVALLAMLLVVVLLMSGTGRSSKPIATGTLQDVSRSSLQGTPRLASQVSEISRGINSGTFDSALQTAVEAISTQTEEASPSHRSSAAKSAVARSRTGSAQPTDRTTLWQQVKKGRSDAEVELALIYLEGTGIEQNCEQARVLLRDASRKGNTHAADWLANPVSLCH